VKIWKVVVAVMVIFGAGVVTGGFLVRVRVPAPLSRPVSDGPVAGTPSLVPGRQQFVQRLHRELSLTPEQSAQVDLIMRESHEHMAKIMEPVAPQTREETRRVRQQIQAILTPEQKTKFNDTFKRRQRDPEERRKYRADTNSPSL
jgi:Spy/CpxP family protein refolding chaperone